jgi:hypothetical protein
MLYVIGDSHSQYSFSGIPNVAIHHVGPVTLKRVGYPEEPLLAITVGNLPLTSADYVVFVFGEIDVRCFVKPTYDRAKTTLEQHLRKWAFRYGSAIASLDTKGAQIVIMSVVPPSTAAQMAEGSLFPVAGTDQERAEYTVQLNAALKLVCEERHWQYLDVYSRYANELGMLPSELSDGTLHIGNPDRVKVLLNELRLLEDSQ